MFFCEDVQKQFVHFAVELNQEIVVLDVENFRYKKTDFFIKELSFCSKKYTDTIRFLPPVSYYSIFASDSRSHKWFTKLSHDLPQNSGTYPYWFLSQNFVAIKLWFPHGKFFANGKEKTKLLQSLLQKVVMGLETFLCPKAKDIKLPTDTILLALFAPSTY